MGKSFDHYAAMLNGDANDEETAQVEPAAVAGAMPEEMTATATTMDGADPFDKYAAMLNMPDDPQEPTAPPEDPSLTKTLVGGIEQNVLRPLGVTGPGGAIDQAGQFFNTMGAIPGEAIKDPLGALAAVPAGVMAGGADILDQLVNVPAAMKNTSFGPVMDALLATNPVTTGLSTAMSQVQKLAGGPINLKGGLESNPLMQQIGRAAPNAYGFSQSIPTMAATLATGGEGLAARAALGYGENLAMAGAASANRQNQSGQKLDAGRTWDDAKGSALLGSALAGVLGRRTKGKTEPMPGPEPDLKVTKGTGNQLPVHQPWAPTMEQIQQAQAAKAASPEPRPLKYPHYLDLKSEGTIRPKQPYLDLNQAPPGPKFTKVPPKGIPFPKYLDLEQAPKTQPAPPRKYPDIDWEKPKESKPTAAPRLRDFVKQIGKGGDLAAAPGKPGFRRVKGAGGQSRNTAELVDASGNVVSDAAGKPVRHTWNKLDDEIKPKSVPSKLMEAYDRVAADQPKPELVPPKAEPEAPKVEPKPEPAPEPKPEVKPEPKAEAQIADPVGEKILSTVTKLEAKIEKMEENLHKLETGNVKEQFKKNKETGEMEGTEVRAERNREYIKQTKAEHAQAVKAAVEHFEKQPGDSSFAKAALEGLKKFLAEERTKDGEGFFGQESGQGQAGYPFEVLGAGIKAIHAMGLGPAGLAQHYQGFAAKVQRTVGAFSRKANTAERAKIVEAVKHSIGLANDFDIVQKFDPSDLSVTMSRHRGVLESLMYNAEIPSTVAEREAFAKTKGMSAEEILTDPDIAKSLSAKQIHWAAAVKQATEGMVEDIRSRYLDENLDKNSEYAKFLKNWYLDITGRTIEKGDHIDQSRGMKVAKYIKNAMYDNIVNGNWGIHSIHVWDAVVHGGSNLGKHFWTGAMKSFNDPTVKNYVRGYKGSGLMKAARSGDAPTLLEKYVGGAVERFAEKNKIASGALKIGRALEGSWLEGEKMHVLRAGVLERIAADMKIKGGAAELIKRMESGKLSPEDMLEVHSRQASVLSDIIGYNPVGISNRNAMQRQLGAAGSILQPFMGMRTVQSRLLYDAWGKAITSGKMADLKQAATMHGLLLAVGGAATLPKVAKVAIKAAAGGIALNQVEQFLDEKKILPGLSISHLTPDGIPGLFTTFENASHMAGEIGKIIADPKEALQPDKIMKSGLAVASTVGGSVVKTPSLYNVNKLGKELGSAQKGVKETPVFDDNSPLLSKRVGVAKIGHYDNFDAVLSFFSPHDIDKTHHAKEHVLQVSRALEDVEHRYGPLAKKEAKNIIDAESKAGREIDWERFAKWVDKSSSTFSSKEWKDAQAGVDAEKEAKKIAKVNEE
jgi:hypothetical protein